jgi:hypothetical protein
VDCSVEHMHGTLEMSTKRPMKSWCRHAMLLLLYFLATYPAVAFTASKGRLLVHPRPVHVGFHAHLASSSSDETQDSSSSDSIENNNHTMHACHDPHTTPFAQGSELYQLQMHVQTLRKELTLTNVTHADSIQALQQAISVAEDRDPELVYARAMQQIVMLRASLNNHQKNDKHPDMLPHPPYKRDKQLQQLQTWQTRAQAARMCLPRFHMEGLWAGRYVRYITYNA